MSYMWFLFGMYTANSKNCLTEALGMGLRGNGTIPGSYGRENTSGKTRRNEDNGIA
jgi:dihydroxyacid dehydratase/phosphogluconate dehydratase